MPLVPFPSLPSLSFLFIRFLIVFIFFLFGGGRGCLVWYYGRCTRRAHTSSSRCSLMNGMGLDDHVPLGFGGGLLGFWMESGSASNDQVFYMKILHLPRNSFLHILATGQISFLANATIFVFPSLFVNWCKGSYCLISYPLRPFR